MPTNFDNLEEIDEYPFGLKVFSQYILLPLLLLYLVILYLYGAKIILLWDWPKGVVSWLIIAVAVLGIFALIISTECLRDRAANICEKEKEKNLAESTLSKNNTKVAPEKATNITLNN